MDFDMAQKEGIQACGTRVEVSTIWTGCMGSCCTCTVRYCSLECERDEGNIGKKDSQVTRRVYGKWLWILRRQRARADCNRSVENGAIMKEYRKRCCSLRLRKRRVLYGTFEMEWNWEAVITKWWMNGREDMERAAAQCGLLRRGWTYSAGWQKENDRWWGYGTKLQEGHSAFSVHIAIYDNLQRTGAADWALFILPLRIHSQ